MAGKSSAAEIVACESSTAERARCGTAEHDSEASGDEDAAAAQQVLENTRANYKRSRDEASDALQDARSSPPRAAKRGRRLSGQVSFTRETQVRVFYAKRVAGAQGEDDEVQQRDLEVKAKTVDGPPLIGIITSALVKHVATSNSLDVFRIRHAIRATLIQCEISHVTALEEVDILYRVHTKLQDFVMAIQERGSVGILPGSMSIGTGGLVALRQLQGALREMASAIVAPTHLLHSALPGAKSCLLSRSSELPRHSAFDARPER
jgi:hypothetical protein